jgi:hypothetical protein
MKNLSQELPLGPRFEPSTCWIQIRSELLRSERLNSPNQIKVYFNARRRVSCNLSPAEWTIYIRCSLKTTFVGEMIRREYIPV